MRTLRRIVVLLIIFLVWGVAAAGGAQQVSPKEGKLIVRVLIGDDNSPARDAFVYVRGYRPQYNGEVSVVLTPSRPGRFEISLQPGLYDIFVSEGSLLPLCRRVVIAPGVVKLYTAKPEVDEDHLEH